MSATVAEPASLGVSSAASVAPAAPAVANPQPAPAAPSVTLTEASFMQLVKAAGAKVGGDVETAAKDVTSPSKVLTAIRGIPADLESAASKFGLPITFLVASAALALHFVKFPL